jgi:hypothetical protein
VSFFLARRTALIVFVLCYVHERAVTRINFELLQWGLVSGNRRFSTWGSDAKHRNALSRASGFAARAL